MNNLQEDNPIIFKYNYSVPINLPSSKEQSARRALNKAWGFEDGNCNYLDVDKIIGKPGSDNPDFLEANKKLHRITNITIEVCVYKNGNKTFRIL